MKYKHLFVLLVLLNSSCKVTEKSIVGVYVSKKADVNTLRINSDHTFLYNDLDLIKWAKKADLDSCNFMTSGKWRLSKNELILDSYDINFIDTGRIRKIFKTAASSAESNFSFEDINGRPIHFYRIDDAKGNFAYTFDKDYASFDIDLTKHNRLMFYFTAFYNPLEFGIIDSTAANYKVILAPFYKTGYFQNKAVYVKYHKIKGTIANHKVVLFKGKDANK